jgi:hypothetical protein
VQTTSFNGNGNGHHAAPQNGNGAVAFNANGNGNGRVPAHSSGSTPLKAALNGSGGDRLNGNGRGGGGAAVVLEEQVSVDESGLQYEGIELEPQRNPGLLVRVRAAARGGGLEGCAGPYDTRACARTKAPARASTNACGRTHMTRLISAVAGGAPARARSLAARRPSSCRGGGGRALERLPPAVA